MVSIITEGAREKKEQVSTRHAPRVRSRSALEILQRRVGIERLGHGVRALVANGVSSKAVCAFVRKKMEETGSW